MNCSMIEWASQTTTTLVHVHKWALFSESISLDISCELSAKQTIHMKCQDIFSLKNKKHI